MKLAKNLLNILLNVLLGVLLVLVSRSAVTEERHPTPEAIQATSTASIDSRSAASHKHIVDLGKLDGRTTLTVTLDDSLPEVFYKLTIGCGDCVEWERIRFDTLRNLTVTAHSYGTGDELGLELTTSPEAEDDATGGLVSEDSTSLHNGDRIIEAPDLGSGYYYIRIFKKAPKVDLRLTFDIAPLPLHKDKAGNKPATARKLGVLANETIVKDFIGENDPVDFYHFRLNKAGDLSIVLDGLDQGDVALSVLKGTPHIKEDELENIRSSDFDGDESEEIFLKALPKGDYLVKIDHISGTSDYTMRLRFGNLQFPDRAGSDVSNALNVGSSNQNKTFRGYLDEKRQADFYRFQVSDAREVFISRKTFGLMDAKMELLKQIPCSTAERCEEIIGESPSDTYCLGAKRSAT